jgi:hypothetical protein
MAQQPAFFMSADLQGLLEIIAWPATEGKPAGPEDNLAASAVSGQAPLETHALT